MLTSSYKGNLVKPEMDEDLKYPNARMTWEQLPSAISTGLCFLGKRLFPVFRRGRRRTALLPDPGEQGDRAVSGFGPPFHC